MLLAGQREIPGLGPGIILVVQQNATAVVAAFAVMRHTP